MREIQAQQITDVIERLCIEANEQLPEDIKIAIHRCRACEDWGIAQGVLDQIITNFEIAGEEKVPICQDTGMACVFLEIGQDVHITGGDLTEAVDEGVRRGYDKGYLRKSVVREMCIRDRCSRVCPEGIPLQLLNRKFIKDINTFYGEYQAGADTESRAPLTDFTFEDVEPGIVSERGGGR